MTKPPIFARLDVIADIMQDLDYLHSWTEEQLALHNSLSAEFDELSEQMIGELV